MTSIHRVTAPSGKYYDFGAIQSAQQLLDNFPPHQRERIHLSEMTAPQIETELAKLGSERQQTNGQVHGEWLDSRIEFYSKALESAWKDTTPEVQL